MNTIQGLHGDQEDQVGRRKVILSRTGKGYGPEEIQKNPHFWEVFHQGPQGLTKPFPSWSGPETCVRLQENIR